MKKPFSVLFAVILLAGMLAISASAAPILPIWAKPQNHMTVIKDFDINLNVAEAVLVGPGSNDIQATKIALITGQQIWNTPIDNNSLTDSPNAVALDAFGQAFIAGQSADAQGIAALVCKLTGGGQLLFMNVTGGIGNLRAIGAAVNYSSFDGQVLLTNDQSDGTTENYPAYGSQPNWSKLLTLPFTILSGKLHPDISTSGTVVVWNPADSTISVGLKYGYSGNVLAQATFQNNAVRDSVFIPGDALYTAGNSGAVARYNAQDLTLDWLISISANYNFKAIDVNDDSSLVAVAADHAIYVRNAQTNAPVWQKTSVIATINDVAFFGPYLVTVGVLQGQAYMEIYSNQGTSLYTSMLGGPSAFNAVKVSTAAVSQGVYCSGTLGSANPVGYFVKYLPGGIIPTTTTTSSTTTTTTTTTTTLPPTCEELLQQLIDYVRASNIKEGIENSLDKKLINAQAALTDITTKNYASVINRLQAFINEVQAQSGNYIPEELAQEFIVRANAIKACVNNLQ